MERTIKFLHTFDKNTHLRPILIAPIEDEEGVRLAKEILFIQLVGTELHGGYVLGEKPQFILVLCIHFIKYGLVQSCSWTLNKSQFFTILICLLGHEPYLFKTRCLPQTRGVTKDSVDSATALV